jgi:hypothetical protein
MIGMMLPKFQPAADAPGRFRAAFPGAAVPVSRTTDTGLPVQGLELSRDLPPERYFVFYFDSPQKLPPEKVEPVLAAAAADLGDQVAPGAEEIARQPTTHDGHVALDVRYKHPPGEMILRCVHVPGTDRPDRIYVVGSACGGSSRHFG